MWNRKPLYVSFYLQIFNSSVILNPHLISHLFMHYLCASKNLSALTCLRLANISWSMIHHFPFSPIKQDYGFSFLSLHFLPSSKCIWEQNPEIAAIPQASQSRVICWCFCINPSWVLIPFWKDNLTPTAVQKYSCMHQVRHMPVSILEEPPTDQKDTNNSFLLGHFNATLSCLMFNVSGIIVSLLLSPINTDQRHQMLTPNLILPSWSPNQ